jgi:hypothetical protein
MKRKIVVNEVQYRYKVGRTHVIIRGPDKQRLLLDKVLASGNFYSWTDFAKKHGLITPQMIRDRILEHFHRAEA